MNATGLLIGAAAGSGLMFVLDPATGRRRRALVRDQVTRAMRQTKGGFNSAGRDIANRADGLAAKRGRMWQSESPGDRQLTERVRARLGRVCSHPRAIDVEASDGRLTLRGAVLQAEVGAIIGMVSSIPGVVEVHNQMDVHSRAENVPSLQGEGRTARSAIDLRRTAWAPSTGALMAAGLLAGTWIAMNARWGSRRSRSRNLVM